MKNKYVVQIWIASIWILITLIVAGGATYAWFTFEPYTNIEPMGSTISAGDVGLLISNRPDGGFESSCALNILGEGTFVPVSTADLTHFYEGLTQTKQGIVTAYKETTRPLEQLMLSGTLYLKSMADDCDVYLYAPGLAFGGDNQLLSALRLGLKVTVGDKQQSFILSLDSLRSSASVEANQTTTAANVVVAEIGEKGLPSYQTDPSVTIERYTARLQGNGSTLPEAGENPLCTLQYEEVAQIQYWLYLEGCDENCIEAVQNKDGILQLSFAGVIREAEE